jgi:hypothetical protein
MTDVYMAVMQWSTCIIYLRIAGCISNGRLRQRRESRIRRLENLGVEEVVRDGLLRAPNHSQLSPFLPRFDETILSTADSVVLRKVPRSSSILYRGALGVFPRIEDEADQIQMGTTNIAQGMFSASGSKESEGQKKPHKGRYSVAKNDADYPGLPA